MGTGVQLVRGLKRLPRTIKENIIPISIMFVLWMIPAIFVQMGKDTTPLKPLNFLTAGKSGILNPNVMQMAGGIASKSMILTFLIGTLLPIFKKRSLKGVLKLKGYFSSFSDVFKKGLKGIWILFIGIGLALVLHGFMSTDFTIENSFVSIIGALYAINIAQKFRIPGIQGLAPGFLASFVFAYFSWNTYMIGAGFLALGVVLLIASQLIKKPPKQIAALVLVLVILSGVIAMPALANGQVYSKDNPGVELVLPNAITAYEPFEVVIRISNPDIKKQVNRIDVKTSISTDYVQKPKEDADGKNYHGEAEVKFSIVVNEYISDPRKLELQVLFKTLYKDSSGTQGEGMNLWLSQGITQQTQIAEVDLPSQYTFTKEGNTPFTNSFNFIFTETVDYTKANFVGFGRRFQIQMHTEYAGNIIPDGLDAFDIIAYGLSQTPENPDLVNPKTMEAPQALLETFGASKGALILYENQETVLHANSTEILKDLIHLDYYFYYLKGTTIFKIWGEVDDGVFEASVADIAETRKKELYDAMASVHLVPVPSDTPIYPVEVKEYYFEETSDSAPISTEDTIAAGEDAATEAAATPFSKGAMAVALVAGIFAIAVGSVAAGAMGASASNSEVQDQRKCEYQLLISKSVGRNIRSDQSITLFASVYERIYENDGTFSEMINRSLSEKIGFSSPDAFIKFSEAIMSGDSRAVAFLAESNSLGKRSAPECTISCDVSGPGGTHRQNVVFSIVDEPYVAIKQKLFVWAGSGITFEWSYEPRDFVEPIETVSVSCQQGEYPFEINVPKDLKDNRVTVKDRLVKKPFTNFFDSYTCEIVAKNKNETARTIFYVVMCHEGITVDFLGGRHEILAKLKDDDSGEMVETRVKVRGGLWNKSQRELEMIAPEGISLKFEDEKDVFTLLEATSEENPDEHTSDGKSYLLSVSHSLPSMDVARGKLHVEGTVGERTMSGEVALLLEPDRLTYEKEFEKEYLACKRIIEVYMSDRFKSKKLLELERTKRTLGLADLKVFRENCWGIAQRCIMQERQQYIIDEAWYDEAIATSELLVYMGDIAFDLALSPIGGPIAGFLAAQVKASFLEVVETIIEHPEKPYFDIIWDFVSSRIEQTIGSADGLIEVPKATEQKKLAIWLSCYVIYRIGFHWWYDKDDEGQSIGITGAAKAGLQDFVGKGFGVLLGDYIGKCGKGRWPEKISVTDADQDLVNTQVSKATKAGLDVLDNAAAKADDVALALYHNLMSYFKTLSQ